MPPHVTRYGWRFVVFWLASWAILIWLLVGALERPAP